MRGPIRPPAWLRNTIIYYKSIIYWSADPWSRPPPIRYCFADRNFTVVEGLKFPSLRISVSEKRIDDDPLGPAARGLLLPIFQDLYPFFLFLYSFVLAPSSRVGQIRSENRNRETGIQLWSTCGVIEVSFFFLFFFFYRCSEINFSVEWELFGIFRVVFLDYFILFDPWMSAIISIRVTMIISCVVKVSV